MTHYINAKDKDKNYVVYKQINHQKTQSDMRLSKKTLDPPLPAEREQPVPPPAPEQSKCPSTTSNQPISVPASMPLPSPPAMAVPLPAPAPEPEPTPTQPSSKRKERQEAAANGKDTKTSAMASLISLAASILISGGVIARFGLDYGLMTLDGLMFAVMLVSILV